MENKKYRAFGHVWHIAHDAEILKIPDIQWDWLIQYKRQYGLKARGDIIKQYGVNMVNHYEPGKYDFALLHFDQQCFEAEIMERGKGSLFKELNDKIQDIPKIIICHGTPYYPEKFPAKNEFGEDCDGISQELIDRARDACKGCYVIVNSKKAAEQWGFGTPIWHGMSPSEWFDLPKEPRVITMIGPAGLDKYYDRAFLRAIKESLAEEGVEHCHITVDWEAKDWEDYRQFLGRSLIYINPTKESPMPRSRTEAMLSGCCVLTTPHQDANLFIKDGVNGFMIERNPQKVVEKVKYLLENYEEAKRIGQAGKQTALELFNWERFRVDWLGFVENTIQDFKTKNQ